MAAKKLKNKELKDFVIKNNLLTIRFWSQSFTTSLFDKHIKDYRLTCQYTLPNFNLEILKNVKAAQVYLNIADEVYIARIKNFAASVSAEAIVLQLELSNLRLKASWDMEWQTPSVFYDQILADRTFFKTVGRKLEEYVKPLGIARKISETDQALRRRTLSYLQEQMSQDDEVFSDADLKQLREDSDA